MNKKSLSAEEKKIVLKKISDILRQKECVLFAYVFGSFALGDSFHDVDIGIFAETSKMDLSPLDFELRTEREISESVQLPVDVRIINTAPVSFIYNVLKQKTIVLDRDISLRADFEGAIYKKYFDFRHLRNEYAREIINAPV